MTKTIDIVAFAAHPDDVEISCSGTLLKHQILGYSIGIVDLTQGELGTRGSASIRQTESDAASRILNLNARMNLGFADGFFEYNKTNLLSVVDAIRKLKPAIVLCTAPNDRHPDHGRASKLVSDACFYAGLPKIETAHPAHRPRAVYQYIQDNIIEPDLVVDITEVWEKKLEALRCFKSQFFDPNSQEPNTPISSLEFLDFLKGRAMEMGRQAGVTYAEGFKRVRRIGVKNLFNLL